MSNYKSVSIVIQARSTSTRFPGKIFEKIGSKQILQTVIDACQNSANFVNACTNQHGVVCGVALAVPYSDPLIRQYSKNLIIQGPEDDVLKRYQLASEKLQSDYIVRVTSDCPFIPPFVISKAIGWAARDNIDYLTNADPRFRTAPDGHDVEVISKRLLAWLDETATDTHREHVTSYLVEHLPSWAIKKDILGFIDLFRPEFKLSVDTQEDLARLRLMYLKIYESIKNSPGSYRL